MKKKICTVVDQVTEKASETGSGCLFCCEDAKRINARMIGEGRKKIYTDAKEITSKNVIDVLRQAILDHGIIANDCKTLMNFVSGQQPLQRVKTYRADIDIVDIDNVADEITNFKTSFNWGNPITLVQHGDNDEGTATESKAITELNACFDAEKIRHKTQELANFVEVCGIGYTYIDVNTDYEEGDSYFKYMVLDPRNAFVVRSSYYPDQRIVMNVTFRQDILGNKYYTIFTKDRRYEVKNGTTTKNAKGDWVFGEGNDELNPLGKLPFTEWVRNVDRTGCFERQIPELNALNILASDFANDVDQNTQCIWHANDIEFPKEVYTDDEGNEQERVIHPSSNDWIETTTTPDGKTPFVNPLHVQYDYSGMLANYLSKRALILQKCNVPSRNDNSGGSTGIAMSDATGWTQAEVEATQQDQLKNDSKLDEVKIALSAMKLCKGFDTKSPLAKLKYSDVKPNIKRQKTYEMTTKINAFATGVSHGIDYKALLNTINLFDDPNQVARDSEVTMEKFIEKTFGGAESGANYVERIEVQDGNGNGKEKTKGVDAPIPKRLEQDRSDQISNSPTLDKGRG